MSVQRAAPSGCVQTARATCADTANGGQDSRFMTLSDSDPGPDRRLVNR